MKRMLVLFAVLAGAVSMANAQDYRTGIPWTQPPVVTPGETKSTAPSDAIILFDGQNMDAWEGGPWEVANGVMTVNPGSGSISTKQKFGSVQLHIEFATPALETNEKGEPTAFGQGRGNSGVFLMNHYEVQVLDSYQNDTYFDGQCGSIYKQIPPQANVCRAPGEWQSYDIIFHRPITRIEDGKVAEVIRPATITVIQNGVLVIDNWQIKGDTFYHIPAEYVVHEDKEPISLQDHGNRMQFRNIWVREIPDANIVPNQSRIQYYNDGYVPENQQ